MKKQAEKLRDDLFAEFKKIKGVYYPGKDGLGGEEAFSVSEEDGEVDIFFRFDFQMDDREEIDAEKEVVEKLEDKILEAIKKTEFKDLELDMSYDCWDTFPNAFSAHYIEVYLATPFE